MSDEEFLEFKNTLLDKLPVTFRINPSLMSHEAVLEMLRDPKFIEEYATKDEGQDSFQAVSMAQSGDIEREVELRTV